MSDHETFELGPLVLQCGVTLPAAHLAYKTYGTLAPDRGNVILYPTSYGAHHTDIDWLIGPDRVLDPTRFFIVIPNQLGNGLSTSPSNLRAEPVRGVQDTADAERGVPAHPLNLGASGRQPDPVPGGRGDAPVGGSRIARLTLRLEPARVGWKSPR